MANRPNEARREEMSEQTLDSLRREINEALAEVLAKHNLQDEITNIRLYSDSGKTITVPTTTAISKFSS